jgi:plasmid stabilization system protein ParE
MRRIVFAPPFDREVEDIGVDVEERFGEAARYEFIADLMATCSLLASFPGMATRRQLHILCGDAPTSLEVKTSSWPVRPSSSN